MKRRDVIMAVLSVCSEGDIFDFWEVVEELRLAESHLGLPESPEPVRRALAKDVVTDLLERGWLKAIRYHWEGQHDEPPISKDAALEAVRTDRLWEVPGPGYGNYHVGLCTTAAGDNVYFSNGAGLDETE